MSSKARILSFCHSLHFLFDLVYIISKFFSASINTIFQEISLFIYFFESISKDSNQVVKNVEYFAHPRNTFFSLNFWSEIKKILEKNQIS
jgi:hypothetical protein